LGNDTFEIWLAAFCIAEMIIWEGGKFLGLAVILIFLALSALSTQADRFDRTRRQRALKNTGK
jgi:uncharacterized membrane protein